MEYLVIFIAFCVYMQYLANYFWALYIQSVTPYIVHIILFTILSMYVHFAIRNTPRYLSDLERPEELVFVYKQSSWS